MFHKIGGHPAAAPGYAVCFDPATMAVASPYLLAAGTAVSTFGAIQQGQATKASSRFQAAVQQQQAERERLEAAQREDDFRRARSRDQGTRRAGFGATGVEPGEGSPLITSEDFAAEAELQALRLRAGGELRATRLEQAAALNRFQGSAANRAGFVRGGSLLIRSAGVAFGKKPTTSPKQID